MIEVIINPNVSQNGYENTTAIPTPRPIAFSGSNTRTTYSTIPQLPNVFQNLDYSRNNDKNPFLGRIGLPRNLDDPDFPIILNNILSELNTLLQLEKGLFLTKGNNSESKVYFIPKKLGSQKHLTIGKRTETTI